MRPKSMLLLALALGCGLVASIGISQVMERRAGQQAGPEVETQPIFVALKDVNLNDPLTPEVLKLEEWPKDKVPVGAITQLENVEGRRPRTKIYAGEPILEAKLVSLDAPEAASETIPEGWRVLSVRVDATSSVAGLIKAGDRVDLQLYLRANAAGNPQAMTKTIMQDVRVFAVDKEFRRSDDDDSGIARNVSLLVEPDDADRITLATELGEIRLILRHPDDKADGGSRGIDVAQLLDPQKTDRDGESGPATDEPKDDTVGKIKQGFMSWLKNAGERQHQAGAPLAPVHTPQGPWVMQIIEGASDVREVEFHHDGTRADASSGSAAAPPAASQAVPPSFGGAQPGGVSLPANPPTDPFSILEQNKEDLLDQVQQPSNLPELPSE